MIIAMQMLIYFRESVLAVLNGLVPPVLTRFVRKLSRSDLVPEEDELEEQVYAEYDDESGVVFFPSVHAQRYAAVCDCLMDEQWFGKLQKVLNVGKNHDINFLKYLTELPGINQILGLDIECSLNCTCDMLDLFDDYGLRRMEPLQITLLQGNAADPDYRLIGCDAVVTIEMIQQLLPHDLDRLVHNVFGFIKPWIAVFTTPNADFNIFLKNLDKNGLRQADHYFEWTRAQLHDWCSNIVERYPDYTVISTGVGPGPEGTSHYGCYSQLVLFISKRYKKEMELDVESLVLISDPPEPTEMTNLVWTSVTDVPSSPSMLHRLLEKSSPSYSYAATESTLYPSPVSSVMSFQRDKSAQCNVDDELGKSFVMFHEEEYEVRMPRKRIYGNIYEIGDVANRLNNTMCEVKQFSKTTQYLLEKNEIDISDTQEIMNEISQLSVKLTSNVNRSAGDGCIWNNVNWGENVPYWNQYYNVVGVYNYPCDEKSEDDTILDLILEEINKLIEMHCIDGLPKGCQFEIPVLHLMHAVNDITNDVQRVVNLLEDNGYEMDGDLLVVPALDTSEVDDGEDVESYTDIENFSNESSYGQDVNGMLDRILCRKIKKLQVMLPSDKEIRQELCRIICRLKKIARSTNCIKEGPERSKWLQAKLLELLTINEKSILRRNLRNNESKPFKACFGNDTSLETASHLTKIKAQDDAVMKIVEKYENILRISADDADMVMGPEKEYYGSDITDDAEIVYDPDKPFKYNLPSYLPTYETGSQSGNTLESGTPPYNDTHCLDAPLQESEVLRSMLLIDELPQHTFADPQSDSIHDWEDVNIYREQRYESRKCYYLMPNRSKNKNSRKKTRSKNNLRFLKKYKTSWIKNICHKTEEADRYGISYVAIKNILKNNYSCKVGRNNEGKAASETILKKLMDYDELVYIERVNEVNRPAFISTAPKPIPNSIIELCHPDLIQETASRVNLKTPQDLPEESSISATQKLQIVEILTQNETLTVALQRTIGTSPDEDLAVLEHELELSSTLTKTSSCEIRRPSGAQDKGLHDTPGQFQEPKIPPLPIALSQNTQIVEILTQGTREIVALQHTVGTDPILDVAPELELTNNTFQSFLLGSVLHENDVGIANGTFFLYDLNEPTTSKGCRHVSTDVQCGTDATMSKYALLSATTSLTNPLDIVETELKTEDAVPVGAGSSSYDIIKTCRRKSTLRIKSVGIKIKDSDHKIPDTLLKHRKENETAVEPVTDNDGHVDTVHNNSMEIETTHIDENIDDNRLRIHERTGRVDHGTKKNLSKSGTSVDNNKRSVISTNRLKSSVIGNKALNTKDMTNIVGMRYLRQPNDMKALRRGGVHVHSYNNLQVSEDVVYQGEWQRYRQKPLNNNTTNPIDYTMYKSKYSSKINVPKQTEEAPIQRPKSSLNTIRKIKMSKLKKRHSKIDMQNKINLTSSEVSKTNTTPINVPKVVSKFGDSPLKSSKRNSRAEIQPARQTRFLTKTNKSNENMKPSTPISYIPRYLKKWSEKQEIPKTVIKSRVRVKSSDSLSNLLNLNDEYETLSSCHLKTEDLIRALLKISIEPPDTISYTVYRNETVTSKFNSPVEKVAAITPRPSEKEVLKRKVSNRDRDGYAGSSRKCVTTVINSQPVANPWPNLLNNKQKPPIKKSDIPRKTSDSKMFSRIKRLANKIISTRKTPTNATTKFSGSSTSVKSSSNRNVDLVLKPSVKKTYIESTESKNESVASDNIEGSSKTQEPKMDLVLDQLETKSNQALEDIQDPVKSASQCSIEIADGKVTSDLASENATAVINNIDEGKVTSDLVNESHATAVINNIDEGKVTSDSIYDCHTTAEINNVDEGKITSGSINDCHTTADIHNIDEGKVTSDSINDCHTTAEINNTDEGKVTSGSINVCHTTAEINNTDEGKVTSGSINVCHTTTEINITDEGKVTSDLNNECHITSTINNIDERKVTSNLINAYHTTADIKNIDGGKVTSNSINDCHTTADIHIIDEGKVTSDSINDCHTTAEINNTDEGKVTSGSINVCHTTAEINNTDEGKVTSGSINVCHTTTEINITDEGKVTSDLNNECHITSTINNIDERKVTSNLINAYHTTADIKNIDGGKVTSNSINDCHTTADINNIDEMQQIIIESLNFFDTPCLNGESEAANVKHLDFENDTSTDSGMYVTCSSPAYDGRSLNHIQSISDFSFRSASFISKISECFADNESCTASISRSDDKVHDIWMETISLTRKPKAGPAFSTFSINSELNPLLTRNQPDHVNRVDSETGSIAVGATRLTASEDVLVSGRTSHICVLDEEAEVPNWLFQNRSRTSGSAISQPQVFQPIVDIPEPFELGYDENGNELPVQVAAGAGDGHGVHSDLSQDSSGRGTTSSSSLDSSRVHSEFIVVDPETFAAQYNAANSQANTSNIEYSRPASIDTSFTSATGNPNSLGAPNRSQGRPRETLPASDADVSSINTDVGGSD